MSRPAIIVENLGKSYRIGQRAERYPTFREALVGAVKAPLRRFRALAERGNADDTFWALKDISFTVEPGEVVGIIGHNGAGKSTLLKVLSRITEPTQGCIRMRGRVASLLEVGTGFHPELTGRENIYLNGAILGMRKAEIDCKFDEIVAFSEIEKFLDTPVKRYSSGMYVRLAFAVAAHLDPEILIIDEVLAVGDTKFQRKCLGKMQEVTGEGRTVLFVSHSMKAVQQLCVRAVILENGQILLNGPVEEAIAAYLNEASSNNNDADLFDRHRRLGLAPVLGGFRCYDQGGLGVLTPGQPATFEIDYRLEYQLADATVGIHIQALNHSVVMALNTRWERGRIVLPAGQHTIRCHVEHLPLAPGQYLVALGVSNDGRQVDYLEQAGLLEVKYADYFGTGEMPYPQSQGHILHRSRWEF